MDPTSDPVVAVLDLAVRSDKAAKHIDDVLARILEKLAASSASVAVALEFIPLAVFDAGLPEAVKTALVTVVRPGTEGGGEGGRQPRSAWSLTLTGSGAFEILEEEEWVRYVVVEAPGSRWTSIPPGTWYSEAIGEQPWGTLTFDTRDIDELFTLHTIESETD